jgi:hypothetical protein
MNILFLTVTRIEDINSCGIYTDLLRHFVKEGHKVYVASPTERRFGQDTRLIEKDDHTILQIKTLNIQKTNFIEKGVGTILLEYQFEKAIDRYFKQIRFDLILYSTPPITLTRIIEKIKTRDRAKTYLLLKDIFPQNAVDIGMMSPKGVFYRLFRKKEQKLYQLSDYIGCMSPANVQFLLEHNPEINSEHIEVCPNSVELATNHAVVDKDKIRKKFDIPVD